MLKVVLGLVLSQYVRSHVDDRDPASQCLWWPQSPPIELRQSVDGNPETPGDTEFAAVSAAVETWRQQLGTCASLGLSEGARTRTRKVGYFEKEANENIVVFRLRRCSAIAPPGDACFGKADNCGNQFDCWQHQESAIAITTTSYNPDTGRILDSDIEFNTPTFVFTTVDTPPCLSGNYKTTCVATDVQNTTTHELGHLLGLSHSATAGSTMASRANPGEMSKRQLDAQTAQFVCDVYPSGAPSRPCVLKPVSSSLGKPVVGCSAAPFGWLVVGCAAWFSRRRARP